MKSDFDRSFGFLIHDVARAMRWSFDRKAQGTGLTRSQWSVLAHLKRNDGVQQQTLAKLMDIAPITLARHIDRLEQEGWVERRDDPKDRRAKRVNLTEKVTPMLKTMQKLAQTVRKQAMKNISAEEEDQLITILSRIRDNFADTGNK